MVDTSLEFSEPNRRGFPAEQIVMSPGSAADLPHDLGRQATIAAAVTQKLEESLSAPPSDGWQGLGLRKQVVILAIAAGTVPLLVLGAVGTQIAHSAEPIAEPATLWTALLLGTAISAGTAGICADWLSRRALRPLQTMNALIQQLIPGKVTASGDALGAIETHLYQLSSQLRDVSQQQARQTQQRQLLSSITNRTRQTRQPDVLFETAVQGAREILKSDRVIFYRFNPDWTGTILTESVDSQFPKVLDETIGDPCFYQRHAAQYQNGRIRAINDIYKEPGLTDCHIRLLEQYRVRANLVVPIRRNEQLYGLLIAHQCAAPRIWTAADVDFMAQLATEVDYSLDYVEFASEQTAINQRAWLFGEIAFRARQSELDDVYQVAVQGARQILQCDRALVYWFNPDWSGTMIAESVDPQFPRVLNEKIDDPCFRGRYVDLYRNGRVRAINNIRQEPGLTDCHIRTLEKYEVKANLVAPLRHDNQLVGLLIVHQCAAPRIWQETETHFLAQLATQVEYAIEHLSAIEKIQATADRARLYGDVAFRARQTLSEKDILRVTVQGALKTLKTDRVVIYRFTPDWAGRIVAEAINPGWTATMEVRISDPCFRGRYIDLYRNGRVRAINDIYSEPGLTDCHIRTLEQFEVRANLVAPIRRNQKLYGLLIAHHCTEPRVWQKTEIDFFAELAIQAEYALDHISFIEKLEQARQTAELASQEQRRQTEAINAQLEALRQDIQGSFGGDLTVRTTVTGGEIGMVAEFFNAAIANLQHIVLQVQTASEAVTQTAHHSVESVNLLSTEALRQSTEIAAAQTQVQAIAESMQGIAANAQQAQQKVQDADRVLQAGDEAMNRTVEGISAIQETVEETAQKVKRLGEASQKISRVVNLIRDLANQTNVLALNASLEANNLGSPDQGFTVVAEEVRSLAERSAIATREIEQIVGDIQTETEQVVTAMETGRGQVIAGTELVETTRQTLTSIASVSAQIRHLVEDMAQAATTQTQTSMSVAETMQAVEAIAQKNSEQSIHFAESFTQLLDVAQTLQQSVAQFKGNSSSETSVR
jgi:methyl-accepting chemotaxis protein PixJ